MPKTHLKHIRLFYLVFIFALNIGTSQETTTSQIDLIPYLQQLEKQFNIKFSYVDEDLNTLKVILSKHTNLNAILEDIKDQTLLKIEKLNERYYTLTKTSTVDICAKVLDNFANNTIAGATIEVMGSSIAITTDIDGHFYLENIPRKANIRIRHIGFKTQFVLAQELANTDPCSTILMAQNYQELEEVVVYKFLTTGLSKQLDASILLNTSEFGILPGLIEPDVLQTVQALPGIKSTDETVSDINIRGGTNDQNLILWDDIKMYQSGHFFGLISAFNPYLIDNVTIIKNGTSAAYGDGVSSVISMQTNNDIEDRFYGGAGFNLISADVYGQIPIRDKLALQFSARRSGTDFFNTPTYNSFFDRVFQDSEVEENDPSVDNNILREERFFFYDLTGKVLYDFNENHKVRLSLIHMNNNLDYSESVATSGRTSQSNLTQTNLSFGGSLESTWNPSFSSKINYYYTRYNLDSRSIFPNNNQQLSQTNRVEETGLKIYTNYQFSDELSLQTGYQFNETGILNFTSVSLPPFTSDVKGVIRTHAVFSEIGYESPNKKMQARAGMRLNYIENLGTFSKIIAEPRINFNYVLSPYFKIEVLGEFKSQTTNQVIDLEQNFLGIEKRRWIISDDETLPITTSKQGSIGLNYDQNNLYVGLEGFYKEVQGVSINTQGFQNQNQFGNEIGSYDIKGIEFLINKKSALWSTWLSYAFNVNDYTFENLNPSSFPNNLDITHTLTFAGTYTYKKLKLGIGLNYRTGKPFTEPQEGTNAINTSEFPFTINYQNANSSRLPEYIRADASATYTFALSPNIKATAGASILNFTDRKNILNTYYRLNSEDRIETVQSVSLGLTPNLSFRVQF